MHQDPDEDVLPGAIDGPPVLSQVALSSPRWQNASMTVQITIRNVPGRVRDALASRAAAERKSMQEYLLGELERLADRPSPAQWLARVRRRKSETGTRLEPARILDERDADRRATLRR